MLQFLWTIQQHTIPVGQIKIVNGAPLKAMGIDLLSQRRQLFISSQLLGIARTTPPKPCCPPTGFGDRFHPVEVIHQSNNHLRAAALPRKRKFSGMSM
jgi:hypothetical protein